MIPDKLNIIFISDIHVFHRKTPTKTILKELKYYLEKELDWVDIIYISGDFYDTVLTLPKEEVAEVDGFIYWFLRACKDSDVQLRILEGTPSHDGKQGKMFVRINELANIQCDIKYYPELTLEYNERYGIYTLYIPDEWDAPENTLAEVKELLKNRGIDQVDIAIMHGNFHYQLPAFIRAPKHNEEEYLKLVRYFISIGHIHRHTHLEHILAQGSFSRLAHGEEDAKGFIKATIYKDGSKEWSFVENTLATKYITIDISNIEDDRCYSYIENIIKDIPQYSHIRLVANSDNAIVKNLEMLISRYPFYYWTNKILTKDSDKVKVKSEDILNYQITNITPDNIERLLKERLVDKGINSEIIDKVLSIVKECS